GVDEYGSIGVGSTGGGPADRGGGVQPGLVGTFARHTMKFGADHRNIQARPVTRGQAEGSFAFSRAFTRRDPSLADNASGNSIASFLLGYPAGSVTIGSTTVSSEVGGGNERSEQWY